MELKTKVDAEDGKQELFITREFDLPLESLFKAFTEPELIEQWMGTKVLKLESKKHGSYKFETRDAKRNVTLHLNGVIHELIPNKKITRTFEMENLPAGRHGTPFGVQLEIYKFEKLTDNTSKLNMHMIFESVTQRDQVLKLPFAQGLNMAHNRIREIVSKLKK
jgi:uncharacterized protein YndB with AHSA1/START domain